ncbi:autotransporter assembly complex family protein [Roseomonas sp. HF4]|uniref:autotransporter assembly complex protein TamA n=1 Tax=Roseomonas sp. HF4 TaxID=2562313 RepID=UPI0010BF9A6E|nr:autotransporter assembly complex family protein [Roseomonas sp. HF4]
MMPEPYPAVARSTIARGALAALALLLACRTPAAQEQAAPPDPPGIPYEADFAAPEDLAALARGVAQTVTLRDRAPTDAFGLIGRVRADLPRLQEALRAEGYWGGSVAATIAGRPPEDPALPALLQGATDPVPITFTLTPGERYAFGRIGIAGSPAQAVAAARAAATEAGAIEGEPARTAAVIGAEDAMLAALRRAGHPLAAIDDRQVLVDHDRRAMDVAWRLAPGPTATFDRPSVSGQVRTNAGLMERTAARRIEGRDYSPETLERGRRALAALGVFDSVRAEPGTALTPDGHLPVNYAVSERPLRAIGGNVSYETNFGLGLGAYWEHRNLFGGAERLRLEAEAARLGESNAENFTYRAFATLTLPEIWRQEARLTARVGAVRERLEAYDRDAVLASALAERALTERLALQAGPLYEAGRIGRYGNLDDFALVGFVGGVRWDSTTSLLDPTSGQRASLTVTPFYELNEGTVFTRILATGSAYFDVTGDARGVLALRTAIGATLGATRDEITLDRRFYSGGGGSVRGYTFQSIGPRDSGNKPLGGASVLEVGAEWRQRISGPWGMVAFVDAGTVGEDSVPGTGDIRVGVGLGLRYLTAIGPIRVDVGVPLNADRGDAAYALYVGIGQAF